MLTSTGPHPQLPRRRFSGALSSALDAASPASERRSTNRDEPCAKHLLPQGRFLQHLRRAVTCARGGDPYALYVLHVDHLDCAEIRNRHAAGLLLRRLGLAPGQDPAVELCASCIGHGRFSLLKPGCRLPDMHQFANRIRATLERDPFAWRGRAYRLGVSVGGTPLTGLLDARAAMEYAHHACDAARDLDGILVLHGEPTERATIDAELDWHEHLTRILG